MIGTFVYSWIKLLYHYIIYPASRESANRPDLASVFPQATPPPPPSELVQDCFLPKYYSTLYCM